MSLKIIESYFNRMKLTINSMFSRGEITLIDDTKKIQSAQGKFNSDEVLDDLERFQDYGFTSKPKPGAEALAAFFGGRRSHGVIFKVDDRRYRLKGLEDGEVAVYTDEGDKIVFKRGNKIEVSTAEYVVNATTKIKLTAPLVEIIAPETTTTGKITADLDIITLQKMLAQIGSFAGGYNPYIPGQPSVVKGNLSVVAEGASPGNIESVAQVKDSVGTMAQMRTTYNAHKHSETNTIAGTSTPDQVM